MIRFLRITLICLLVACILAVAACAEEDAVIRAGIAQLGGIGGLQGGVSQLGSSHFSNDAATQEEVDLGEITPSVHDRKPLTLMVYLCGTDLEASSACASLDILEMLESGFDQDSVNLLLFPGGSFRWAIPEIPIRKNTVWDLHPEDYAPSMRFDATQRYTLEEISPILADARKAMEPVSVGNGTSMGDPATLCNFLNFCSTYYPADRYALVLWNHGGGPNRGVCVDRLFDDDSITVSELLQALSGSPFAAEKLEWIGFDACLMGSAEVAKAVAPYASYMLASEEVEPGSGWNYAFLNGIENDESGAETGRRVADAYIPEIADNQQKRNLTLSCIDLSRMEDVSQAAETMFSELDDSLNKKTYVDFAKAREAGANFGHADDPQRSSDYDLVDLSCFISRLDHGSEMTRSAMTEALDTAIVYSRSSMENTSGLSIYYPYFNATIYDRFAENYKNLSLSESYVRFVEHFVALETGSGDRSMVDWSDLDTNASPGVRDVRSLFSLNLTEAQLNFLASAHLQVFEMDESESYALVSVMPEIEIEGTTLSAEYVHRALFIVDEAGNPISPGLPYTVLDNGGYSAEVELSAHNENGEEYLRQRAVLHFTMSNKEGNIEVSQVLGYDDVQDSFLQRYDLNLADYDTLEVVREYRKPTYYPNGTLCGWNDWEETDRVVYTCRLNESEGMMMLHDIIDHDRLFVAFALRDYQNNRFLSGLSPLVIIPEPDILLLSYDDLDKLVLDNAQFMARENGTNTTATMSFDVQNISGKEAVVRIENVCFEGQATELTADLYGFGSNNGLADQEKQRLVLIVPSDVLMTHEQLTNITFDLVLLDPEDLSSELGRVSVVGTMNQDLSFMHA